MSYTNGLDDPSAFFQCTLYTGNGSNDLSITNSGNSDLQPDWVWIKQRDSRDHFLFDSVRGVLQYVASNTDAAESTLSDGLKSFNSNGFTIDDGVGINQNNDPHVSWNWKAGTSFTNDASSTGIGATDSAGSVNETAGFSVCTYTGVGGTSTTIKHGLSTAPTVMLIKNRSSDKDWGVYHQGIGNTHRLYLNLTDAATSAIGTFRNTSPTSSIFTVGDHASVNTSGNNYVAYIFSERQGYSKFGKFFGNANVDGTFVYTGFKPALIIFKNADSGSADWVLYDNKRDGFNSNNIALYPNANAADDTGNDPDILSNGFKQRATGSDRNGNGENIIYMAFAENPFVTSTGVPATAR
mgnify:CR=1 FL=1